MHNAIYLDNPVQAFLVKQAITEKICKLREKGFKETDVELEQLKNALPKMREEHGTPIF